MRFAITTNGGGGMDLESPIQFVNMLAALKSEGPFYSLAVYPVPDAFDIRDSNPWDHAIEYLQSAGSATGMTIEIRRSEGDELVQYTVARPGRAVSENEVEILWNRHRLTVFEHEVFDSDAAAEVYQLYWNNEATLPDHIGLRRLDLG